MVSLEYNPFTQEWKAQRSDEEAAQLAAKLEATSI